MRTLASGLLAKLIGIISLGILVIVIAFAYSLVQENRGIYSYDYLLGQQVAHEREILQIEAHFKIQVQNWKDTLIRGATPALLTKYWGEFRQQESWVHDHTASLIAVTVNPKAKELLQQFLAAHEVMGKRYRHGLEEFKASGFITQYGDKVVAGMDRAPTKLLAQAADAIANSLKTATLETKNNTDASMRNSIIAMIVAVLLTLFALVLGMRSMIMQPIDGLVAGAARIAAGDFSVPVRMNRSDEIGTLSASIEKIRTDLGSALNQVVESAHMLATESSQLASISSTTTKSVAAQQQETALVATAINQMSATVGDVAQNAALAAEAARKADEQSHDGHRIVTVTIKGIDTLANETERSAETINRLQMHSQKINGVLEVIRGIAEQTNLLALNAAIEAARAGEHGRGFAVVAEEVRTLASRTQQSTQDIHSMIEELQSGSSEAVSAMNQNLQHARQAVEQAGQAGQALLSITEAVAQISDMNNQIASAAEEQGAVAEEINRNVTKINELADESAEGAANITTATGHLNALAETLEALTKRFTL